MEQEKTANVPQLVFWTWECAVGVLDLGMERIENINQERNRKKRGY